MNYVQEFSINSFENENDLKEFIVKNNIGQQDIINIMSDKERIYLITNPVNKYAMRKMSQRN